MSEQPVTRDCRILRNVPVAMRDGVALATTVMLPPAEGRYPTVMVRTSYNRLGHWQEGLTYVRRGYAFVAQDCRGRFDSPGDWYPFTAEGRDGFDTLAWLGRQPWCNGRVGMVGASYEAAVQFYAATEGAPHLASLIPMFMTGDPWRRAYYADGAFSLALNLIWLCFEVPARTSDSPLLPAYDLGALLRRLPLLTLDEAGGLLEAPAWRDYVRHSTYDDFWKALSLRGRYGAFSMPALFVGGWYDYYAQETFTNYLGVLRETPEGGRRSRVLMGPWGHGVTGRKFGELDFGEEAAVDANGIFADWFDRTLKGEGPDEGPPIRIFVMGENGWRDEREWPLARARRVDYYLHSDGRAGESPGGGSLSTQPPAGEPPDCYTYDPQDPVPTLGGNHSVGLFWEAARDVIRPGPFDQRPIEGRPDVLLYTSEALAEDLEVTGPVVLVLFAASSAPDTDFCAKLCDVHPDGRSINITEGVIRARFRERNWERPRLIEPGAVLQYEINLQATSNVFKAGHRIRLHVTSSNFPLWDRNPNTGAAPGMDAALRPARQTVLHDRARPSRLVLPVVPR